jgi:hypothetical protein
MPGLSRFSFITRGLALFRLSTAHNGFKHLAAGLLNLR